MKVVGLKHFLYPTVEALDHATGLRMLGRGQAVFDAEVCAEPVKLVPAGGLSFAQTEQAVGESLAIIGENGADAQRAGTSQIAQKAAGIGGCLGFVDADEYSAGGPINRYEQVAA